MDGGRRSATDVRAPSPAIADPARALEPPEVELDPGVPPGLVEPGMMLRGPLSPRVGQSLPAPADDAGTGAVALRRVDDGIVPRVATRRSRRSAGRVVRRAVRVTLGATLIVLLAACAAFGVGSLVGRWRLVPVLSDSMQPTVPSGAAILVTPLPTEDVRVGDIIVFEAPTSDHRLTVHRVVEIIEPGEKPLVHTAGDANPTDDPWKARLTGDTAWKVRRVLPGLGHVSTWLSRAWVRFTLAALCAAIVFVVMVRSLWPRRTARP